MVLTVTGYVTEIDKWGRINLMFPRIHSGTDRYGTEAKLRSLKIDGSSPIGRRGFVVRPDERTLYMINSKRVSAAAMLQQNVLVEIDPQPYDFTAHGKGKGVSFKLISMRCPY